MTKKMRYSNKKENACRFVSAKIKFYCAYLNKEVEVEIGEASGAFSGWQSECDLCGGHGGVNVRVNCECGHEHNLDVYSC